MRILLLFILLLTATGSYAQQHEEGRERERPVNLTDNKGKRHGMWVLNFEARHGDRAYTEIGTYVHGKRYGAWYKIDSEGDLMAIENYANNTLNGEVKYYDMGKLYCEGNYRGLNPNNLYDTIMVEDPVTGFQKLVSVPTERGSVRHGTWAFYDMETGRLIREELYQVDELINRKEYSKYTAADSAAFEKRNKMLPHNTGQHYTPPKGRGQFSYTDY